MQYEEITNQKIWDDFVAQNSGHPLQFWGWGEVKSAHGWSAKRYFFKKDQKILGGAQILKKQLQKPFPPLLYSPRGPIIADPKNSQLIFETLENLAKSQKNLLLKIDPHILKSDQIAPQKPFKNTKNGILLPKTAIIDLSKSPDEIKSTYSKKTRQYINKSAKEVSVERLENPADLEKILEIYHQTAKRAHFSLHNDEYYRDIHKFLGKNSQIFIARAKNQPENPIVAFLWLATSPLVAFELYGGMNDLGQKLRANFILKQYAIESCKNQKIQNYDLNGLLNDGVSNFKEGFAAPTELIGAYDLPGSPLYSVWDKTLPAAKKIIQHFRR